MQARRELVFGVATSKAEQNPGELLQEEGKIFGTHARRAPVNAIVSQDLLRLRFEEFHKMRVVNQQWVADGSL